MGIRIGDIIWSRSAAVEGIVLGFKNAEYNENHHYVIVFCTYSKYTPKEVGRHLELNQNIVSKKR